MYEQLRLDRQLCFRLYTLSRLVTQAYHPYLDPLGLTYPQYLVLLVLWERDGQAVCDIAERLSLETNTVTPLLQRMERNGLLTRTRSTVDGRQHLVHLTRKGRLLQHRAKDVPECMTDHLSQTHLEAGRLEQLVADIDAMTAALKASL